MRLSTFALLTCALSISTACDPASKSPSTMPAPMASGATLARVYFWRAKPGQEAAYDRYVREVAEPIDHEAQRAGAFLSVTTMVTNDTTLPYTHMRVFMLRDSAQLNGLSAALN